MNRMPQTLWLIVLSLFAVDVSLCAEPAVNPYSYFDTEYTQWKIGQLFEGHRSVFALNSQKDYLTFKRKNIVLELPASLNDTEQYRSKLGPWLGYYLTDKYKGVQLADADTSDPFYISSYKLDNNLSLYVQKGFSITFSLRPGVRKAQIIDIIPSHEDILPWLCTKEALLRKPACFDEEYETDDKNVSIVVNVKIFPKTLGKHFFKLYVLTRVNDAGYVIMTIPGHFNVVASAKFKLFAYQPLMRIQRSVKSYRYLWLKNEDRRMMEVTDVVSFGTNLKLSYPLEFELKEFKEQHLFTDLRRMVEENEKRDFWLVPASSERPIFELVFNKKTADGKLGMPELDWIMLQNNLVRIIVDKVEYLYGLTTFFAEGMKFWDHDFVNAGVFGSRHVYHEFDLYVSNKTPYPAVLEDVLLEWDNDAFSVHAASYYKNPIALPFYKSKLKIAKLLVAFKGAQKFAVLRGKATLKLNVLNKPYYEHLHFFAMFAADLIQYQRQKHERVISEEQMTLNLRFVQNSRSALSVDKIELLSMQDATRRFSVEPTKSRLLKSGESTHLLTVAFDKSDGAVQQYKEEMLLMLHAFETIITKRVVFYYDVLVCSPQNNAAVFRSCKEKNVVNFGYLRERRKSIKRLWIIKNAAPTKHVLSGFTARGVSKLFDCRVRLLKFDRKTKRKELVTEHDLANNGEYKLDTVLRKHDRLHVEATMSVSSTFKTFDRYVKHSTDLLFATKSGDTFTVSLDYGYIKGKITVRNTSIAVDLVYPGPLPRYAIRARSSYLVPVEIEDVKRVNDEHNLITISGFSNMIEPKSRTMVVEFVVDPRLLVGSHESMPSQTASDANSVCLHDIDKYHDSVTVWNKLRALNAHVIDAELQLTTQLGTKIRVKITGSIRPPDFLPDPLFLGYNVLAGTNKHDLVIKNPYSKPVEVRLFLAPASFLDVNRIDAEVIAQIKAHEQSKADNLICMANKNMSVAALRFYAESMYLNGLKFVQPPGGALGPQVCFKVPEKNADTEGFYKRLASLSNFLFEFTHFKIKDDFLRQHTILISDIERYTVEEPVAPVRLTWKDRLSAAVRRSLRLGSKADDRKMVKTVRKFDSSNFKLNHIKDVEEHIQHKEMSLDPAYLNRSFVIRPRRSLTLKHAITLRPGANNSTQPDRGEDLMLILKNNVTGIHPVPIKYQIVAAKLSAGSERVPSSGSKLVFNVDPARYFNRASFSKRRMQARKLIKEDFYFENKGLNAVRINGISIGDARVQEPCLRLLEFRPKIILPQTQLTIGAKKENSLKATFAFHMCRRLHTNTTVPIYLQSDEQVFEFEMVIVLGKYIVKSVNSKASRYAITLLLAFFVLINAAAWLNLLVRGYKRRVPISYKPKKKADVFLPDERLKDRIIRYQAEIKLKMYENSPKPADVAPLPAIKKSPIARKGFKLMPEENQLNQFDYSNNLYPFIRPMRFNDNSCISEETFEKLFPNASLNNSSDNEANPVPQRDQLFANSYVIDEEEELNKNYGTIGDQSGSNFNMIANEASFNSRDRKLRKKSQSLSHEAFVNSIIIDQRLNEGQRAGDSSYEDARELDDEYNEPFELVELDYAFGTNLIPKDRKKMFIDSRKRSFTDYASMVKPEPIVVSPRASDRRVSATARKMPTYTLKRKYPPNK